MPLNRFDAATTPRLSLGLLASSGALLLKALDLSWAATLADKQVYAERLVGAVGFLVGGVAAGLFSFFCVEIAEHPVTPVHGHPHSRSNYLETAFALLVVTGLFNFMIGGAMLVFSVVRQAP